MVSTMYSISYVKGFWAQLAEKVFDFAVRVGVSTNGGTNTKVSGVYSWKTGVEGGEKWRQKGRFSGVQAVG